MEGLPQTQQELNDFLTSKMLEHSNQLLSTQILLYSIVDLVIEKELVSKEDLESMIDTKKEIVESYYKYTQKYGKNCFYCNEAFTFTYNEYTPNNGNNRAQKGVPRQSRNLSFDRLDTSKTYFIDNIIFCCTQCNSSKNDISISLIYRLYEIITERNL